MHHCGNGKPGDNQSSFMKNRYEEPESRVRKVRPAASIEIAQ